MKKWNHFTIKDCLMFWLATARKNFSGYISKAILEIAVLGKCKDIFRDPCFR